MCPRRFFKKLVTLTKGMRSDLMLAASFNTSAFKFTATLYVDNKVHVDNK